MRANDQPRYNTVNPFIAVKGGAANFIAFVVQVFDATENKPVRTPDKDGSLIHAEIQLGDSMLLVADSKPDWVFTPALLQVYVASAQQTLDKAVAFGAKTITPVSPFYNGIYLARMQDKWGNLWWLYEKISDTAQTGSNNSSSTEWHNDKPSGVYTTLMEAMQHLKPAE